MFAGFVLFLVLWCPTVRGVKDFGQEPLCLSRYDYDYKIWRTIVLLEQKVDELEKAIESQQDVFGSQKDGLESVKDVMESQKDELKSVRDVMESQKDFISNQEQEMEQMRASQTDIVRQLKKEKEVVTSGSGSTYVRWGRTLCPDNGTETVYTGYAAGSHFSDSGAAVNYICLPTKPLWGEYDDSANTAARIYGAEYEVHRSDSNKFFKKNVGDNDVACAVCRTVRPSLLMIPGRNACYDGWTVEYTGYLSAGYYNHTAATEYVCLDADPEVIAGSQTSQNGKLFYMTEAKCGALPCPPYVEGRELTCVVCSL